MMNDKTYKIKITIEDQVPDATLIDNPTTRDFLKMLPMSMELKDYAATEKIYDLPERLSPEGAPSGMDPPLSGHLDINTVDIRKLRGYIKGLKGRHH